ncbi:hypothetical protein BH23ACT9_BH23ACT9_12290 [soil metagenome]
MTYLVERLGELRAHVRHVERLRDRVSAADDLRRDRSLHNDLLFSLLMIAQLVVDVAGELSARDGRAFDDYTTAVRNLAALGMSSEIVEGLTPLPGFRNVVLHDYVELDLDRAVEAMHRLGPVEDFIRAVAQMEQEGGELA